MIDQGRNNVMGVVIDAVDYERAVAKIIESAQQGKRCATTALAVHGLITGVTDEAHRFRLNQFDLVVPDGQPVRWALNVLHRAQLTDRVYGPKLSLRVCEAAARQGVSVYFFGSSKTVIQKLCEGMSRRCPGLQIAGARPSEFRTLTEAERNELVAEIQASGAQIRDASNLIVQPGAVPPRTLVKYTLDSEGYVHRVWILTQQEAAQRDKAQ